jgi:hypothetical protein
MKPAYLVLPILAVVFMPACMGEVGEEDEDFEEEPTGQSSDAIISSFDCNTTKMAAYDHGSKFTIDVIKIGSKRASKPTGHAFLKMQKAAHAAGVALTINSGFRTNEEQQYFYNCYKTKKCNSGNLAAKPGYSNHQSGRALDLQTSSWLASNASKFGFKRTVPSEPWHYEYSGADPGGPCSSGGGTSNPPPPPSPPPSGTNPPPPPPPASGSGQTCGSDGQCNPGNDGSGLICEAGKCVDGCRSNAQCPGSTMCKSGKCQ